MLENVQYIVHKNDKSSFNKLILFSCFHMQSKIKTYVTVFLDGETVTSDICTNLNLPVFRYKTAKVFCRIQFFTLVIEKKACPWGSARARPVQIEPQTTFRSQTLSTPSPVKQAKQQKQNQPNPTQPNQINPARPNNGPPILHSPRCPRVCR